MTLRYNGPPIDQDLGLVQEAISLGKQEANDHDIVTSVWEGKYSDIACMVLDLYNDWLTDPCKVIDWRCGMEYNSCDHDIISTFDNISILVPCMEVGIAYRDGENGVPKNGKEGWKICQTGCEKEYPSLQFLWAQARCKKKFGDFKLPYHGNEHDYIPTLKAAARGVIQRPKICSHITTGIVLVV